MYRDSAPGSIARGLQRVSRHRGWRLEKQIILSLTHGHRKVAVFFISSALPVFVLPWQPPCFRNSDVTSYRTNPVSNKRLFDA